MVYGICRERYDEEAFRTLDRDLDFAVLEHEDPEAAQEVLNQRALED